MAKKELKEAEAASKNAAKERGEAKQAQGLRKGRMGIDKMTLVLSSLSSSSNNNNSSAGGGGKLANDDVFPEVRGGGGGVIFICVAIVVNPYLSLC